MSHAIGEMNRREQTMFFFQNGAEIAAVRAELILAVSKAAQAYDRLGCGIPSFSRARFVDQVMDTADAMLEQETREDLGL